MALWMMRRCSKGGKKSTTAALIASLAAAAGGVVAAFIGREAKDGGPPKEFPWLLLGIASAALLVVCVLGFVQWRRKSEERSDSEEGGSCSR